MLHRQSVNLRCSLFLSTSLLLSTACGGSTKTVPPSPTQKPRPPEPQGPTRTDFKTIAKKLVSRCVAGGWINRWRSEHQDVDVAKPKIHLRDFEDRTEQNLDATYLNTVLEQRMRLSGVYEMVSADDGSDFIGRGKLLRLSERDRRGQKFSVYTAVLDLVHPDTSKVIYSCEATVKGEM